MIYKGATSIHITKTVLPNTVICCFKSLRHSVSLSSFFKIYFIDTELIYDAVLISAARQSDSAMHVYASFFIFTSITAYHKTLNTAP